MASTTRRFGWSDHALADAEEYARGIAAVGRVVHVVEVMDEGEHTVQSQPHDPVGVIYVVDDRELSAFTEQHDGAQTIDTLGCDEDELAEEEPTYKIIRFHQDDRPREIIETGLTLAEAQAHCKREDTHGPGWFDGYEEES